MSGNYPSMPSPTKRVHQPANPLEKLLAAAAGGTALFLILGTAIFVLVQAAYWGRIMPGVHVAGIDLSGLRQAEAAELLSSKVTYPDSGLIFFKHDLQEWAVKPSELGFKLDTTATFKHAYQAGRSGWPWERIQAQFQLWQYQTDLPPVMVFDGQIAQQKLDQIAAQINQPAQEAFLQIESGQILASPGQIGLTLNSSITLAGILQQLHSLQDGSILLVVDQSTPAILDISKQTEIAKSLLSDPLTLTIPNAGEDDLGPWRFDPETLAGMLSIQRVKTEAGQEEYQVALDHGVLETFLLRIGPGLAKSPNNARYIFNDDTRQLEVIRSAVIGRELNIPATIEHINRQIAAGAHQIDLVFDYDEPPATDGKTAEEMGITELVSSESTYFYGSSAGRMQNIQTAAAQFHGLLVPPGATFSMVDNIGDISLDSGYAEAWIIYGDRTIKGVGGGVCQVSTTLFRTVFFGGYPVVKRYSHAYRVYYYELNQAGYTDTNMAGLDATVFAPLIDFQFKNDSPHWLLMETYVDINARRITWKFYSTSDGRVVEWESSGLKNRKDPPDPIYEENKDLPKGTVKQVDWEVEGADVIVYRTVTLNGEVIIYDEFKTHYEPWADVYQYGPGTKNMPPDKKKKK